MSGGEKPGNERAWVGNVVCLHRDGREQAREVRIRNHLEEQLTFEVNLEYL